MMNPVVEDNSKKDQENVPIPLKATPHGIVKFLTLRSSMDRYFIIVFGTLEFTVLRYMHLYLYFGFILHRLHRILRLCCVQQMLSDTTENKKMRLHLLNGKEKANNALCKHLLGLHS